MSRPDPWRPVRDALDRAGEAGRAVRVWLRDDDAVTATPALDRLARLCEAAEMPVLLAVVPAEADETLAAWIAEHPGFAPCQHGYAHANHAACGQRACELGADRPLAAVLDELRRGCVRLRALFGPRLAPILVPPWNRIDGSVIPHLQDLGFTALSVFGAPDHGPGPRRIDADLDIIDWRRGRVGRGAEDVAGKLMRLVDDHSRSGRPIGLLTHHLAHDETAWAVLETLLQVLRHHPAAAFTDAASLVAPAP